MFLNADIGPVHLDGNPGTFVLPTKGGAQGILKIINGKLSRLIEGVPTIHIEKILIVM